METQFSKDQAETIVKLGFEGGSITLFKIQMGDNEPEFFLEYYSIDLDENDEEVWRTKQYGPMPTWEEGWNHISASGEWVMHVPKFIHPDICSQVRSALKRDAPQPGHDWYEWFSGSIHRWCVALRTAPNDLFT